MWTTADKITHLNEKTKKRLSSTTKSGYFDWLRFCAYIPQYAKLHGVDAGILPTYQALWVSYLIFCFSTHHEYPLMLDL